MSSTSTSILKADFTLSNVAIYEKVNVTSEKGQVTYNVITCRYHFSRHHNYFMPDTDALCDKVELTIEDSGINNFNLYEWYILQLSLNGSIKFSFRDQVDSIEKTLYFTDAKCFSLSETYDINKVRLLKLEFMASSMSVGMKAGKTEDVVAFKHN